MLSTYSTLYRVARVFITDSYLASVFSFDLMGADKLYNKEFYILASLVPFRIS